MALFFDKEKPVFTCGNCKQEFQLSPSTGWNRRYCSVSCSENFDLREKLSGVIHDAVRDAKGKIRYGGIADKILARFDVSMLVQMREG